MTYHVKQAASCDKIALLDLLPYIIISPSGISDRLALRQCRLATAVTLLHFSRLQLCLEANLHFIATPIELWLYLETFLSRGKVVRGL